jgi:hypothetical protein
MHRNPKNKNHKKEKREKEQKKDTSTSEADNERSGQRAKHHEKIDPRKKEIATSNETCKST